MLTFKWGNFSFLGALWILEVNEQPNLLHMVSLTSVLMQFCINVRASRLTLFLQTQEDFSELYLSAAQR